MASIEDAPPECRNLARRIDPRTLERLAPLELQLRVEEAAALLAEAELEGPGRQADRLRRQARKVLNAMTPAGLSLAMQTLGAELHEARLSGADRKAAAIAEEMRSIDQANPQPDPERILARAKAEVGKLSIPPAPQVNSITRRFARRRAR